MEGNFQKSNPFKHILPVLYDIKPVRATGGLDLEKIKAVPVLDLRKIKPGSKNSVLLPGKPQQKKKIIQPALLEQNIIFDQPYFLAKKTFQEKPVFPEKQVLPQGEILAEEPALLERPFFKPAPLGKTPLRKLPSEKQLFEFKGSPSRDEIIDELEQIEKEDALFGAEEIKLVESSETLVSPPPVSQPPKTELIKTPEIKYLPHLESEPADDFFKKWQPREEPVVFPIKKAQARASTQIKRVVVPRYFWYKPLIGFVIASIFIALAVPGLAFLNQGLVVKENILASGLAAYQNLLSAKDSLEQANWQGAEENFALAYSNFNRANQEISGLAKVVLNLLDYLGSDSLVSSGAHLVKAGQALSAVGQELASAINLFSLNDLLNLAQGSSNQSVPLTERIVASQNNLRQALNELRTAEGELGQLEDISQPFLEKISDLKAKMPLIKKMLEQTLNYSDALLNFLGQRNPRQYLLVFQNNSEARATGGFIGTYGLLALDKGEMKKLFIEGVFNADGQLIEKVIPPQPIQKISTAWSMHDANWFADFPTSAQKIAWFYEKTGGPTVDGVIGLTPTVIERLLNLTGPIEMPEYGVVLSSSNFTEIIQYKVELDYNKELNQPKQILADFAPKFIKALAELSSQNKVEAVKVIFDALKEKHILLYFKDSALEEIVEKEGWAGQLLVTDKDYFSVVSSNINGFKTDRVIKETISHQAEIQPDGSIIDILTIRREHQGGNLAYDWFNRVNSDYLRVYLPLGSQLISAVGQTQEQYQPPIDYQKFSFRTDSLVAAIESRMKIDQQTGTQIFEENSKTVFGNWLYVSPGKTAVLTYKYKLPFKIDLTKTTDNYSLLVQKQSGSLGSQLNHSLKFPSDWTITWQYLENLNQESGIMNYKGDLQVDRFLGATFEYR